MYEYNIYLPSGEIIKGGVAWDNRPTLAELHDLLDQWFPPNFMLEPTKCMMSGEKVCQMIVDEDARMRGAPHNALATKAYRRYWATRFKDGIIPSDLPDIVGPAAVFDRKVL